VNRVLLVTLSVSSLFDAMLSKQVETLACVVTSLSSSANILVPSYSALPSTSGFLK
jgi:hypothetical protein